MSCDIYTGATANPFHPRCRITTCPYFDDMDGERFARGIDGETYYVPSNMTYKEWYKQYIIDSPLNQAKNVGVKHFITNQAIEKVPYIEISGYTEQENRSIQLLHQELLKVAKERNNSNEVMMIKASNGNVVTILGLEDEVNPANNHDANLLLKTAKEKSIIVAHNHPGLKWFSLNDLRFFLTTESVKL